MYGNARIIDGLYSRGVLYDKPGDFSPLAESCLAGNIETTERLLELGFDVDALNGAPLHNAVAGNHVDVVLVLVRKGVDVNVRGVRNETPLFHARSVEVAKALIEAGADVNAKDDAGVTCLDSHLFHSRNAMTFEREHSIVRLLLQHRAHHREPLVEEAPPDAQTILGEAAKRGDAGAAGLLDSITSGDAVDFGCVLPVRSIPKSALGGILPAS
jgi:ankyrin repeat protein